ncbi:transcription factor mef2A isoform X2 [Hyposmocoma kahamanoa]|uniref:transcription factor mef2A isoform X2 n=1 Tax=Hyposmocoma kahamanoa TaxID=1477025 RepID=UPI000E6D5E73|nr:transcription factor mef2A isoform X2 [Hyposmocoma kahamanoa]
MFVLVEIVVSLVVLVVLITAISACVCGCKNSNQKASTQNSQRSLPEIPHPVGRHDSGDTASEIYATVNLDQGNKTVSAPSTSRDHAYEHAYAKLQNQSDALITVEITPDQSSENVIQIDERDATQNGPESVVISASVAISGQLPSSQELPYITPPSPRPHNDAAVHFSGDSTDSAKGYTSISVREPLSNIRAQSAKALQPHYATVSDDSDEMYAAIEEASVGEGSDTYAQIAPEPRRREPSVTTDLLNSDTHQARRSAPPEISAPTSNATHSRQASSSSCSNSTGALGSPKPEKRSANSPLPPPPHTSHASHATHTSHASHASHGSHATHPAQQRVTADQRQHQRISSTGDLFSHDKLRRSLNEKHQRNNSCVSSSDFYGCNYPVEKHRFSSGDIIRPLVAKELNFDIDNRERPGDNLYNSIDGPAGHYSDYSSAEANTSLISEQRVTESPSRNVEEMYAKVMKRAKGKDDPARRSKDLTDGEAHTSKYRNDDPGYETIDRKKSANHGYETIAHKERKISNQDPGYETVKDINITSNSNYSNNNLLKLNHVDSGPNSIISSDAGYEHISKTDNNASDSEPNYEVLRNQPPTPPYATIAPSFKVQPTYSTVNKRPSKYSNWPINNNDEPSAEPNYESMPHDPLYTTGSESDPNYESVRPKDSNYESMNTQDPNYESLRCKDPKYESVRSKDSVRSRKDPNYESVKYYDVPKKEPPYERLNNDAAAGSDVERSDSSAGYEKINIPNNRNPKSSINNGGDGTVSDYFQV